MPQPSDTSGGHESPINRRILPPATDDSRDAIARIQSRVDAAAFALLREGKNPTVALVRARMGGGSPNIVAPALQQWRLTFAAQLDENAGSALEILPPGVLEIMQALWSRALFEAHRVRADARSAADALEQLQAAITDLRDRIERLRAREEGLDARERELNGRRQMLDVAKASLRRRSKTGPVTARAIARRSHVKGSKIRKLRPKTTRASGRPTSRTRRR
jgi:hypothetical protein